MIAASGRLAAFIMAIDPTSPAVGASAASHQTQESALPGAWRGSDANLPANPGRATRTRHHLSATSGMIFPISIAWLAGTS